MAKRRVLCFGDSNTWGYVPGTGERYDEHTRWTRVAQTALGEGYELVEEGLNGRMTVFSHEPEHYKNGYKGLEICLMSQKPLDLVVIFLGTNDLVEHSVYRVGAGAEELVRLVQNCDHMFKKLDPIFPHGARVLLVAPMPYHPSIDEMNPMDAMACGRYAQSTLFGAVYANVAKKKGVDFLDAGAVVESSPIDGVHLEAAAHRALGRAMAEKIREILEEK